MNLARVILNIVTAFVACHAPRAVLVSARPSTPQAVIAVATVDQPVECLRRHHSYFPPAYLLYSEVTGSPFEIPPASSGLAALNTLNCFSFL